MSPRLRRTLRVAGLSLAVLGVLVAGGAWWIVGTDPGAQWGFERLDAWLPGELKVGELHGPLRGPLVATQVTYKTETMDVTIDRLALTWRLQDMLRKRLDIHRLDADGVRVLLQAQKVDPGPRPGRELPDIDLPLDVLLRSASVRNISITAPGATEPLTIDHVDLATTFYRDTLGVDRLTVRSPKLDAVISGRASPRGDYPVDLVTRWTLRLPGYAPMQGNGTFTGSLRHLLVSQRLTSPTRAMVVGDARDLLRGFAFDGKATLEDFEPSRLRADWPEGRASGTLAARGTFAEFEGEGRLTTTGGALGPLRADFQIARERGGADWRIRRLLLADRDSPGRLEASGTIAPGEQPTRLKLDARWRDLPLPLTGTPRLTSPNGNARVDGDLGRYTIRAHALLAGKDIPPGPWDLTGRGDSTGISIARLRGDFLEGEVRGTGSVAWRPGVRWRLALEGERVNPGVAWAGWPGQVAFEARTQGRLERGLAVGRVDVARLQGTLRERPLDGHGGIVLRGRGTSLDSVVVQLASARLEANGDLGDRWSLAWSLAAPDLAALVPRGGGALTASGTVAGPGRAPVVRATLAGDSLYWGANRVIKLTASADMDLARGGPMTLDVLADRVRLGARGVSSVTLTGRGTREAHTLGLAAVADSGRVDLELAGGLPGHGWRGHVRRLDADSRRTGAWHLAQPAPLAWTPEAATLDDFCWVSGEARWCADGARRRDGAWRFDSELHALPLALIEALVPGDLHVTGPVNGHLRANADVAGALHADVRLEAGPGTMSYLSTASGGGPRNTPFERGLLTVQSDAGGTRGSFDMTLPEFGSVAAEARLPGLDNAREPLDGQPIAGRLEAHLSDLDPVQGFVRQLSATRGKLDLNLAVSGTLPAPADAGPVDLRDGAADVPGLGLELRAASLKATSTGGRQMAVTGQVTSGPGTLAIEGKADLGAPGGRRATLTAKGQRVQVMNTRRATLIATPDMKLEVTGSRADLSGQVEIADSRIEPRGDEDRPPVAPSPDVVFVGPGARARADTSALDLHVRMRLVLGSDIAFKAYGLSAQPIGTLVVVREPNRPSSAIGELRLLSGIYRAYGQDLTIERGRLIYGGQPVTEPALDLRASRQAGDVTAGFEVRGSITAPEFTVFSDPSMAQSQALAYIVLGHRLDGATSKAEGALMNEAAGTLGIGGGNVLAQKLAGGLGLDEARIETGGSVQESSLMLGTALSPRLSVHYGIGLFDPVTTLRLRYLVNRMFTVQVESAAENSADILYTIEK